MGKKYYLLIYVLLMALVISSAYFILKSLGINLIKSNTISTQNAYLKAHIAQLRPEISAKIAAIKVKDFADVKKGELLFELDCTNSELAAQKAQIALDMSKINYKKSLLASSLNEQECKRADFLAQSASAKAKNAASEFARVQKMYKSGAASSKNYESAKEAHSSAAANLSAAFSKQTACSLQQKLLSAEQNQAQLAIEQAAKALEDAGQNISRCKIYAPFSGTLSALNVGLGELVDPSKELAKIIGKKRWVQANIKESELSGLKVGDKANFTLLGSKFSGKIAQISAATGNELSAMKMDNSVGNFIKITQRVPVIIEFDSGEKELASGLSVELEIFKNER